MEAIKLRDSDKQETSKATDTRLIGLSHEILRFYRDNGLTVLEARSASSIALELYIYEDDQQPFGLRT